MSPDHWHTFTAPESELVDTRDNHAPHPIVSVSFVLRQERVMSAAGPALRHSKVEQGSFRIQTQMSLLNLLAPVFCPLECILSATITKNQFGSEWGKRMVQLDWRISELSLTDKLSVHQFSKDTEIKPQGLPWSNVGNVPPPSVCTSCYKTWIQTECADIRE